MLYPEKNRKLYMKGKAVKNVPPHTELLNYYSKKFWKEYAFPHSSSRLTHKSKHYNHKKIKHILFINAINNDTYQKNTHKVQKSARR